MSTWLILLLLAMGLLLLMILIRVSEMNSRMDALENVMQQAVTHDDLRAIHEARKDINTTLPWSVSDEYFSSTDDDNID